MEKLDLDALKTFSGRLPAGARILAVGCGSGMELVYFRKAGFEPEAIDPDPAKVELAAKNSGCKVWRADPMLLSLPKESYDAIWANRSLIGLPPHGCQRVMGSFFAAIKSRGHLFVSIDVSTGQYSAGDFASLIRQSGFTVLMQGKDLDKPELVGFVARRI
jgi:SAM-dependent methyltransferase